MTIQTGINLNLLVDGAVGEEHYNALMKFYRFMDALVQCNVISATVTTPPTSPNNGDCYLVPTGATGAWVGHVGTIARYVSGTNSGAAATWEFIAPRKGWQLHVNDDVLGGSTNGNPFKFDGTTWVNQSTAGLLNNAALTGTATAPTATSGTNNTQIANTAFVQTAIANLIASSPDALNTLNELATALNDDPNFATHILNAMALLAPLANPVFTGNPQAPTPAPGDSTTSIATTQFVAQAFNVFNGGMVTASFVASEAIPAGALVNLYNNGGTFNVRNAIANTTGKEAHGYVLNPVVNGGTAVIFFAGMNNKMSGLTTGVQYLSAATPGQCSSGAPNTAGQVYQQVGIALSATNMLFSFNVPLALT